MILLSEVRNGSIQGWGLLSQFPPFRYFPKFPALSKHTLTIKYYVHIWQVSPQLSCGTPAKYERDLKYVTYYCVKSKFSVTQKLTNGALVTPTPGRTTYGNREPKHTTNYVRRLFLNWGDGNRELYSNVLISPSGMQCAACWYGALCVLECENIAAYSKS